MAVLFATRADEFAIHFGDDLTEVGVLVIVLVDADDGPVIAAADAGDVTHLDLFGGAGVLAAELLAELACAEQMAGHVIADADVDTDGRLEAEVGIEACDGMHVFDGDGAARGDLLDLAHGDVADGVLHMAQIFEDSQLVTAGFDVHEDFGESHAGTSLMFPVVFKTLWSRWRKYSRPILNFCFFFSLKRKYFQIHDAERR